MEYREPGVFEPNPPKETDSQVEENVLEAVSENYVTREEFEALKLQVLGVRSKVANQENIFPTAVKNIINASFTPVYTWIKYADDAVGTNMSDNPTGKPYMGIAENQSVQVESDNPADYKWSLIKGERGDPGQAYSYNPGKITATATVSGRAVQISWAPEPSNLSVLNYEAQISLDGITVGALDVNTMKGWSDNTLDSAVFNDGAVFSTKNTSLLFRGPLTNVGGIRTDKTIYVRVRARSTTNNVGAWPDSWTIVTCKPTGASDVAGNAITQGQIDLANWLNSQPIQQGLLAHWSFDDVPDYPTNPGGTASFLGKGQLGGWFNINNAQLLLQSNGNYIFNATGLDPHWGTSYWGGVSGLLVKYKARLLSGTPSNESYTYGGGAPFVHFSSGIESAIVGQWFEHSFILPNNPNSDTMRWDLLTGPGQVEFEYIYIGNGSYANPLKDQSGNNRSLTLQGGPLAVQGVNGKGLLFNGGQNKSLLANGNPNIAKGSISIWARTTSTIQYVTPIGAGSPLTLPGHWGIVIGDATGAYPDESITFFCFNASGVVVNDIHYRGGTSLYRDGKWHHIVVTQDGTGIKMWVDGAMLPVTYTTRTDSSFIDNGTRDLVVGVNAYSEPGHHCEVDEVRIYNRALSEAEIRYLYTNPGGPVPAIFGAERIMAGSITANEIASKAITTGQLAVDQISNMAPSSSAIDKSKNYWDLTTGGFRVGTADKYILFNPADTTNPVTVVGNTSFVGSTLPWSQVSDKPNFGSMSLKNSVDNADVTSIDGGKITTGFISADRIQSGSIDGKITQIDGGKITTGLIKSAGTAGTGLESSTTPDALTDGMAMNLNQKWLAHKNFKLYPDGSLRLGSLFLENGSSYSFYTSDLWGRYYRTFLVNKDASTINGKPLETALKFEGSQIVNGDIFPENNIGGDLGKDFADGYTVSNLIAPDAYQHRWRKLFVKHGDFQQQIVKRNPDQIGPRVQGRKRIYYNIGNAQFAAQYVICQKCIIETNGSITRSATFSGAGTTKDMFWAIASYIMDKINNEYADFGSNPSTWTDFEKAPMIETTKVSGLGGTTVFAFQIMFSNYASGAPSNCTGTVQFYGTGTGGDIQTFSHTSGSGYPDEWSWVQVF